jgi:DNA-binding response OmpR family regulator
LVETVVLEGDVMARILVVEDEPILCELLAEMLGRAGHVALTVQTGADLFATLPTFKPQLIILDVNLKGGESGIELCRKLRQEPKSESVPVMFLTNESKKETVDEAISAGACDYLLKAGFKGDILLAKVRKALQARKTRRGTDNKKGENE